MSPAPATDIDAKLSGFGSQSPFESPNNRCRNTRRMPIHAQYAAKRLKPEGIGQPRQQFIGSVLDNDAFGDSTTQSRHSLGKPLGHMPAMQWHIVMSLTFHRSIIRK